MGKLQDKYLNKGIELEEKLAEQLDEYDEKVIHKMTDELEKLEAEHEQLKLNGNVRTEFNIDEYFQSQKRLKELPTLISDLNRDRLKAIEDKSKLKESICRGIYAEIGDGFREEFNSNMEILKSDFDKSLTATIKYYNEMKDLDNIYNSALCNTIRTKGIYMTLEYEKYFIEILRKHNLNQNTLNFIYAK